MATLPRSSKEGDFFNRLQTGNNAGSIMANNPTKQPIKLPEGVKKQIFGSVLLSIALFNLIIATLLGYQVDIFYFILLGLGLTSLLYGTWQKKRHRSRQLPSSQP